MVCRTDSKRTHHCCHTEKGWEYRRHGGHPHTLEWDGEFAIKNSPKYMAHWAPPSLYPKQHLDQFIRIGWAWYRHQHRHTQTMLHLQQQKVTHTRIMSVGFRSWSRILAVSLQVTWVINPMVGCHYFPPGLQLPSQPLRGLLPISLLGEQRHDWCEQFG